MSATFKCHHCKKVIAVQEWLTSHFWPALCRECEAKEKPGKKEEKTNEQAKA